MNLPQLLAVTLLASALGAGASPGPYSQGLDDPDNPFDAPVPGFVGPSGLGITGGSNYLNPIFFGWATSVINYSPAPGVASSWSDPTLALGPVTGDNFHIVSLGDLSTQQLVDGLPPGSITLQLTAPIANLSGADFAIFENAFGNRTSVFAELAFVEVSTDGITFARFPSTSLTSSPVGPFANLNPTHVHNLAGKHINSYGQSWGTPFNLDDLIDHPAVLAGWINLMEIRFIRLIDIPGNGTFQDSSGRPIYDPHLTFGSGGFDLEAIGAISRPVSYAEWVALKGLPPHQSAPTADPNGDGLPNLLAYATGRMPDRPDNDQPWARTDLSGSHLTVEFQRDERASDAIFEVQVSQDLATWHTLARATGHGPVLAMPGHTPTISDLPAGNLASIGVIRTVRVTDEVPIGTAPRRFIRVQVHLQPSP